MAIIILIFLGGALHGLMLCWSRQWGLVALLLLVELSWVFIAGGFGLLSLFLLDLTWLYLTALVAILSGVELVLGLFALVTWHRLTGQLFSDITAASLK